MGSVLELLTSENFRKRPTMYVGYREFERVASWLGGFEYCYLALHPKEPSELEGFREWLNTNFGGPANTNWAGVIESVFGKEEEATEKMFECLDDFLRYRDSVGINQIIDDHEAYEIRRYGRINSSRLKRR